MRCWWIMLLGVLATGVCVAAAPDDTVRVRVVLDQGVTYNFVCHDSPMRFDTAVGRLTVPLKYIRGIEGLPDDEVGVSTVYGDAWTGRLLSFDLPCLRDGEPTKVDLDEMPFEMMVVEGAAVSPPLATLIVTDERGAKFVVDAKDAIMRVKNSAGQWDLPLGATSMVLIDPRTDGGEPEALIWFGSNRLERGTPTARGSRLRVRDSFGNDLKIKLNTIREISSGRADGVEPSVPGVVPPVEITTSEGARVAVELPFVVWSLRTAAGDILLPSPLLSRLERTVAPGRYRISTVYGEQLTGRISPERITLSRSETEGGDVTLDLRECTEISFGNAERNVPPGWFVCRLSDSTRLWARPAAEALDWSVPGDPNGTTKITMRHASAVRPVDDGYELLGSDGKRIWGRPADDRLNLVLLCNGMGYGVRWREVLSMSRDPSDLLSPPDVDRQVAIESGVGDMAIDVAMLRRVENSQEAKRSCLTTVFGEHFVGRMLSAETMDMLSTATEGSTTQADKGIIELRNPQRDVPEGWMACRLQTGDVFYMQILEPIDFEPEAGRQVRSEVAPGNVVALSRTESGDMVLVTNHERMRGQLKTRTLELRLLSSGQTNRVAVQKIDSMTAHGIEALPPPSFVAPAFTAGIEGMIELAGGRFFRGRSRGEGMPDEAPAQEVTLSPFLMDATEVTRALFRRFTDDTGYKTEVEAQGRQETWQTPGFRQSEAEPAVFVSWHDAVAFCNWRSRQAGLEPCYDTGADGESVCRFDRNGFRLPTEAEWEYAARSGGRDVLYPWGDDASLSNAMKAANFRQAREGALDGWVWTNPVKAFPPNAARIYGMAGNVWEWCQDWYHEQAYLFLRRLQTVDPCVETHDVSGQTRRVMRGGSFQNELDMLRCASRGSGHPHAGSSRVGFRCVRSL